MGRDARLDTAEAQYRKLFKNDKAVFIVQRVLQIPEQFKFSKSYGKYTQSHHTLVFWQGEKMDLIEKGLSSHHWRDFCIFVRKKFQEVGSFLSSGYYHVTKLEEVSPQLVRKHIRI